MKHILPFRIYESQNSYGLTPEQEDFLNLYTQGTWSVNPTTGLVDIQWSFDFFGIEAKSFFGVKFGNVTGNFNCGNNKLQSLEGAPQEVGGDFSCSDNQLQSLKGAPQEVNGNFYCTLNQLQTLAGAPKKVNGDFYCNLNQLQSLKGAPQEVNGNFYCTLNQLQTLAGAPKEITGEFKCDEFQLKAGKWNMEGWLEVLRTGNEEAKKLILTLPYFDSNFWNSKISENPESSILQLSEFWDDLPDDFRNSIRMPSDLREDFDNLLELVRSGIM